MIEVKIKKILNDRDMSIYKLSQLSGVGYPDLHRLVSNKAKRVDFNTIDKICNALNCQINDLLEFENDNKKQTATA